MRRRDILTFLSCSAVAWPLGAIAQAPPLPAIAILSSGSPEAFNSFVESYLQGMRELGYVNGRNVQVISTWADGNYDRLEALANELVQKRVNVIVASGGLISARAAMKATKSIPILLVSGFDPVRLGLVVSLNRPGGNATGVSLFSTELLPKRLELLHQLGVQIDTTGILSNPKAVTAKIDREDMEDAARKKGYRLRIFEASTEREIATAFDLAAREQVSAFLVTADPFFNSRRDHIVGLAACHAIPVIYPWREFVDAGGLMSYGPELTWAYHLIGQYTGRILRGERPGDLPVQQPVNFKLIINLDTARALGLNLENVATNLISLADQVIEKEPAKAGSDQVAAPPGCPK